MSRTRTEIWHYRATADIESRLKTSAENGLSLLGIRRRLERHGANTLAQKVGDTSVQIFVRQFQQPLVYILLAAVTLTIVLREWADAAVIFAVVIVNATIGFVQEAKALRVIEALSRVVNSEATVVRGGQTSRIPSAELVPGDLVLLKSGDRVPADVRLVSIRTQS